MLLGSEARIAARDACGRLLEVCPIADKERLLTDPRRRKQSEATNLVPREIRRFPAAEPRLMKQFQLLDPPKSQQARIGRISPSPAGLPSRLACLKVDRISPLDFAVKPQQNFKAPQGSFGSLVRTSRHGFLWFGTPAAEAFPGGLYNAVRAVACLFLQVAGIVRRRLTLD
jgi:hypothetical protein